MMADMSADMIGQDLDLRAERIEAVIRIEIAKDIALQFVVEGASALRPTIANHQTVQSSSRGYL